MGCDDENYFQLESYTPQWFRCEGEDGDHWTFGDQYWQTRERGFQGVHFEPIW